MIVLLVTDFLCLAIAIAMLIFLCLKRKFKLLNFETRITLLVTITELALIIFRLLYLTLGTDWTAMTIYFDILARASERMVGWSFAAQYLQTCLLLPSFIKTKQTLA